MPAGSVAIVLPPREAFSPAASGAIGLVVRALARGSARSSLVLGPSVAEPFADVPFQPVRPVLLGAGHSRRYAGGAARLLARLRPALVEVHNRPEIALLLARHLPHLPVMLFLHNDPQDMRDARTPGQRAALAERLAGIVTVSAYLRSRFLDGLGAAPEVTVLPNPIDLRAIPPAAGRREDLILFAGRVVADKGADSFVRACASALPQLPGWRAEMIGADRFGAASPETPFLHALRPQAASAGVAMPGWRPHAEVLAAMARAAIAVVPSRWPEPFGLTALEAMACGAALVYAPRGGLPEVAGKAGVAIDPDDPAGMAAAIVALARNPTRRAALAEAGRRRAASFDLARIAAALEGLRRRTLDAWPYLDARPI